MVISWHLLDFHLLTSHRPTRWDEWIGFTSPRLAPFRTRTSNITVNSSCPAPTNAVAHAPLTGRDDIRTLIPELNRLIHAIQPVLTAASALCEEVAHNPTSSPSHFSSSLLELSP
jgi:hypothetical protein